MSNKIDNYIFLLGGGDLEMITIRDMLQKRNCTVIDKSLSWDNALWEEYASVFTDPKNADKTFVGIELRDSATFSKPDSAILIDHHNMDASKRSSIEQVIEMIDFRTENDEEKRYIALVIANDIGHIKAMKEINATRDEIQKIRQADRTAQGVTAAEEALAERDVQQAKTKNGVTLVYTQIEHFSAITDRIDTDRLFVHSDTSLCYYGTGAKGRVKDAFIDLVNEMKAYYGGSGEGYFGIGKDAVDKDELNEILDKIMKILMEAIVSHHVFMYPFHWDFLPKNSVYSDLSFDTKTVKDKWSEFLPQETWKQQDFVIGERETHTDYNEFLFFYEYVRKTLYNYTLEEEPEDRMLFFNHLFDKKAALYKICIHTGKEYALTIDDINLHIFDTGIGILTFNLLNFDQTTTAEDILCINDFGRRIYPQFLSKGTDMVKSTKKAMLADRIEIYLGNDKEPLVECFGFYSLEENIKGLSQIQLPSFLANIFYSPAISMTRKKEQDCILLKNIMDDRMFTICWYGNTAFSQGLKSVGCKYPYKTSHWWYCYVFGDNDPQYPSCRNGEELEKYILQHTYARWSDLGTLFGVTAESLVCLAEEKKDSKGPPVWTHFTTMYYQMAVLCLLQHASILRFSGEVVILGSKLKGGDSQQLKENYTNLYTNLYANYIKFINRFLFKKITAQLQGIELYKLMQSSMQIDEAAMDLRNDIQELYNYMDIEQQKLAVGESNKLSRLAAFFLPASIMLSVFGLTHFPRFDLRHGELWNWDVAIPVMSSILCVIITIWCLNHKKK